VCAPTTGSTVRLKMSTKRRGSSRVGVTAHRGFIDADFAAAGGDERLQFAAHDRQERLRDGTAVRVLGVGQQAAAEGVETRRAGLEGGAGGGSRWNSSTAPSPRGAQSSPVMA